MIVKRKIRVAIYIRVSTKKQVEEGYSLNAQREKLEKICETNGYIIYKVYSDEGKSGKDTNRPAFQEMMKDMEAGLFDKILVMKLDRISRSVIDLEVMIKEMQKCNVDFESASEKIDTSSSFGMMFVRLLAIFAQFERERIAERINDAFADMIQKNKPITGDQPTGYKNGFDEHGNKIVIIDEDKRDLVNDLFDTYEKSHSLRRAVIYINEKYNTKYDYHNVSKTIKHTHYYGAYKGKEDYCPPYMTKERWDRIQAIRLEKKTVKVYNPNRYYIFSGLIKDIHCGTKMGGNIRKLVNGDESYFYRCPKHRTSKLCKTNKVVNEKWLENYLLENLNEYINDEFNKRKNEYQFSKVEYKDNTKKIAALKQELNRTNLLFTKGRLNEEDYDKEYIRLEREIAKYQKQPIMKDSSTIIELSEYNWQEVYLKLNREQQQAWWNNIIDYIDIDPFKYKQGKEYIRITFK